MEAVAIIQARENARDLGSVEAARLTDSLMDWMREKVRCSG